MVLQQQVELTARRWLLNDPTADDHGSLFGVIDTRNGYLHIEDAKRFWDSGEAPPWADDWGEDEFGLWVTFAIELPDGDFVTQKMRWIPPGVS